MTYSVCILYAAQNHEYSNYGATEAILVQGQSKAKKRIIYFIAVFIVNGLFSERTLKHYTVKPLLKDTSEMKTPG